MKEFKGDRLYVNLGAAQVRRRLKGLGFGVKKVESAGRRRAAIVHTATGQHRRELLALFQDVLDRPPQPCLAPAADEDLSADLPVESLRNLGPTSAAWLAEIGVHTRSDLQRLGAALAYRLVKQRQPNCSLNLLWALEGALTDTDWRRVSVARKEALQRLIAEE